MVTATTKKETEARESFDVDAFLVRAKEEYNWHRTQMEKLERVIAPLEPLAHKPKPSKVESFEGWTIPQCAKQLILEEGHSLTTRQILDKMQERGWTSSSARPITVVHSGLAETPYITRVGKRWDLSDLGASTEF
jgi:hypothetical protein